ncbi:MAG: vWA domain-containing protein [Planctomycetota bacterium]
MDIKIKRQSLSAIAVSFSVHFLALGSLALVVQQVKQMELSIPLDTVFEEERVQEQFEQEIEKATVAATEMTYVAGGSLSGAVGGAIGGGGSGPGTGTGGGSGIEGSSSLTEGNVSVNVGVMDINGISDLGTDLGEGEVAGEVGAAVEGYGAALSRVTQEVVRHMRDNRVLVVWLFDESESMKDDQQEIKEQFHKVYEELGIVEKQDKSIKTAASKDKDILQTMIYGYGAKLHELMKAPSSDLKEIRAAIDKIDNDPSGIENTCMAISTVVDKFGPLARRQKRKLIIVLVTDESGNDGQNIDATIDKVKRNETPVYIMGREAVFGYPYATLRWKEPKTQLDFWLQIDRGPETAMPEALQFDGLHARWDAYSSGFGPYEQVRIAKESGGVFFVLPGEEQNLVGQAAIDQRKFQFYDMKEYLPWLVSRREYVEDRKKSKFRETMWEVIASLNPHTDPELNIQELHYPFSKADFKTTGEVSFKRGIRALGMLNEAAKKLEKIKPLRAAEESPRWRANFDLMHGQILAYRVRLFQALLALDLHLKSPMVPKNKTTNEWHLQRTPKMLAPDAQVVKITKIDMDELKKQEQIARDLLGDVIKNHPNTPWAYRANFELNAGFGFQIVESFRDPRYKDLKDVKLPKP